MRASGEDFPGRSDESGAGSNDQRRSAPEMRNVTDDARGNDTAPGRAADAERADQDRTRDTPQRPAPPRQPPPPRPLWPIPLALLGLLGLALAAILGWGVAPGRKSLPTNFNQTSELTGTANALLSQPALQAGNLGNAFVTNLPVTGQLTRRVLDTTGSDARVLDERSLSANGQQLATTSNTYAVDRSNLQPASNPPSNWNATQAQGLTVQFPSGAQKQDYNGWVPDIQATSPIHFVREESRGGVNTFVYQEDTPATPISNPSVLATLPTTLSKAQLQGLAPSLPLSADQQTTLTQALPGIPDQLPVTYTYQGSTTYWVEPSTGTIVDTSQTVVRNGVISGPGGATLANLPVFNVNQHFTDQSVTAAGTYASDRKNSINSVRTTWPAILGTLGGLALIAGLLGMLMRRRRPQPQPAGQQPTYRPAQPTTYRSSQAGGQGTTETDAARKQPETERGQPQAPYAGQTQHTGPYRESTAGQPPPEHPEQQTQPGGGQQQQGQGQQPGSPPPRAGGG
jgi:hypothetical protein